MKHLLVRGVAIWLLTRVAALVVLEVMRAIGGTAVQMNDVTAHPGAFVLEGLRAAIAA